MENNISWIETVKEQESVYLVNGSLSVPKAEGNRHYKLVQEWIEEGNIPEPEFTPEELEEQARLEKVSEAKSYLASTDWIVTKIAELKDASLEDKYKEELHKRTEMRSIINSLEK